MAAYRARQLAVIRDAIAAGREALRAAASPDARVFAAAYIAAGGVQIPGEPEADAATELARRLEASLEAGVRRVDDPHLQREIDRAHREVAWVAAQSDDSIVGFHLALPASAMDSPTAEALSHQDHGLGPGVFRKGDIVVLQPDCDGARFTPVTEHEVEW